MGRFDQPAGHGGPRQIDAHAGKYFFLPVQRQAIGKLGYRDMGQKAFGGIGFGDQGHRGRCNLDRRPLVLMPSQFLQAYLYRIWRSARTLDRLSVDGLAHVCTVHSQCLHCRKRIWGSYNDRTVFKSCLTTIWLKAPPSSSLYPLEVVR